MSSFPNLPDSARLYIFAASRSLGAKEAEILLAEVDRFVGSWQSHKEDVTAASEWLFHRFLLIGIDESATRLSGCSIDGMVRILKEIEGRLSLSLVDSGAVLFREGDEIVRMDRNAFRDAVQSGRVGPDTVVFNNTVQTVGEWRRGLWETSFQNSWHARAFGRHTTAHTGVE